MGLGVKGLGLGVQEFGLAVWVWEFGASVLGSTQQNNIRDADET